MKGPIFILYSAVLLLIGSMLSGCVYGTKTAELGENPQTKTKMVSFFSKTGLEGAMFDSSLSNTNYTSKTSVQGVETDPETETLPATLGVVGGAIKGQSDVTVAAINALANQRDSSNQLTPEELATLREVIRTATAESEDP